MTEGARLLHWVHKIGDYQTSKNFYENVLGMTEQRHEEFDEVCCLLLTYFSVLQRDEKDDGNRCVFD